MAALAPIVLIGLTLGVPPRFLAAFSVAAIGISFFPASGSQIASIATDETGTTHICKVCDPALVLVCRRSSCGSSRPSLRR
jgi:anaerobic C4-dicarboxylate transporter